MIGLTSREDLERWGCNLYLRPHEVHAVFETLKIYGKSLLRLPNGHAVLDIMDYDEKRVLDDPIFQPFLTGKKGSSALLAFETVIPKDTFLSLTASQEIMMMKQLGCKRKFVQVPRGFTARR